MKEHKGRAAGLWLGLAVTAASVAATWLALHREEAVQPAAAPPLAPATAARVAAPAAGAAFRHFDALPAAGADEAAAGGKPAAPSEPARLPQGAVAHYPRHSGR